MPPTYLGLGHRDGICAHLAPNHNLSQTLTTDLSAKLSWIQLHRQAGGCRRLKYFMWTLYHPRTQRTSVRRFDPYLKVKWLKIAQFGLHFVQIWARRRFIADAPTDPLGQINEPYQLQPASSSQADRRDVRTRLKRTSVFVPLFVCSLYAGFCG